jgi:hypothetical protein
VAPKIILTEISASEVVYDHYTQLFPFSPRHEVNQDLVERLKRSLAETGMWQPIVVRAGTMEGIAGNHRFLANLELAREAGLDEETLMVPSILVDCDEGLAVTIALMENEIREDLTQWEVVRALIKASEKKPKVVDTVFEVDGYTIEQLRLWEGELDHDAEVEDRRRKLHARLTRQWIRLINDRLGEYPELRAYFLTQLQYPSWVQARTIEELDQDITRKLFNHGLHFEVGQTWNGVPTSICLGCQMAFVDVRELLQDENGDLNLRPDTTSPHFCQYLRLRPRYTQQFVPDPNGPVVFEISQGNEVDCYPPEALTPDGQGIRGRNVQLIDDVDVYCVAPDVHEPDSCFHQQEEEAVQAAVQALTEEGLPAAPPEFIREREGTNEFVWHCPQREGSSCIPETCIHAQDDPPGFVVMVQPGDRREMVCIHAECGEAAQEALINWEAKQRQLERQRRDTALDELRRVSVERTLTTTENNMSNLSVRWLLETLEPLLVPTWDTPTMSHVVLGWQTAMRIRIAEEMNIGDPSDREVTRVFRSRYDRLADKPANGTTNQMFSMLREQIAQSDEGLRRWVACLALVRTWRDEVETIEKIAETTQKILSYE